MIYTERPILRPCNGRRRRIHAHASSGLVASRLKDNASSFRKPGQVPKSAERVASLSPPMILRYPARAHSRELRVFLSGSHPKGLTGTLDQSTSVPVDTCASMHVQASSARACRFFAAFKSRSISRPQLSHLNMRVERESLALFTLQLKQVLDDAYHQAANQSCDPYQECLYASWRRSSAIVASCWARLKARFP